MKNVGFYENIDQHFIIISTFCLQKHNIFLLLSTLAVGELLRRLMGDGQAREVGGRWRCLGRIGSAYKAACKEELRGQSCFEGHAKRW
jgi:hypothetical protein